MNEVVNVSSLVTLGKENKYLSSLDWLTALKQNQLDQFLQRGFPTRREEQWKYTDMSALAKQHFQWAIPPVAGKLPHHVMEDVIRIVFVNGHYSPALSDVTQLPKDIVFCPIDQATDIQSYLPEFDAKRYPFAALNTALMTSSLFLSVPDHVVLSTPIHCLYLQTQQTDFVICPRSIICLGKHSQLTLVEEYKCDEAITYFTNAVTSIYANDSAKMQYYKIQTESSQATHVANVFINQKKDSLVTLFQLATGSKLARENVEVMLQETGATCHLNGYYHLNAHLQHIDTHLHVDHQATHGVSTMKYKGILNKKSHAVFNGKVLVHSGATQSHASQENHNLLLSNEAEINTKPELEIYADDIKCTHGATVGQLDVEALFYLRARGIPKEEAMHLLIQAFAGDVVDTISHPIIKSFVQQQVSHYVDE